MLILTRAFWLKDKIHICISSRIHEKPLIHEKEGYIRNYQYTIVHINGLPGPFLIFAMTALINV